jgi:hypothetical protein
MTGSGPGREGESVGRIIVAGAGKGIFEM